MNHNVGMDDPRTILATPLTTTANLRPGQPRLLAKLGLWTVADVLFNFPRGYEDLSDLRGIGELEADVMQTVRGVVEEVEAVSPAFNRSRVGVLIADRGGSLRALWYNQPFMLEKFRVGQHVQFSGKPRMRGGRWELAHPRVVWLDQQEGEPTGELLPVYPLTAGLSQYHMRRLAASIVSSYAHVPEEVLPPQLLVSERLMPIGEALKAIHQPPTQKQLDEARRRFVFQELLVLQLALAARRFQQRVNFRAPVLEATAQIDARITRRLPFRLTAGQREVIDQVAQDLNSPIPMSRLVQGEVGSGKTLIAVYALLVCVAHGYQAALMAPTEILARQHARTLADLLNASRVRHRLLVGGMTASQREAVLAEIVSGQVDLVIGTHALLSEDVEFKQLGLVVIDEQHKFGVAQRAALRRGDHSPHYLVMTATPIPRTIGLTQFGDLDISTLRDMPPGRQPVSTYVVEPDQRERWWHFVRGKLREGRQVFVVTPLVEGSETVKAVSVDESFEALTNGELAEFRVGLLHGRMSPAEKEETMEQFREGKLQVLVATTVIEVGIDVPNASIMVIASPERFGLAQMHQLRGRVGRGSHPGYCGLLADQEADSPARERLAAFAATSNGFELAELDFAIRGPGDLFGTQQHGMPPLRVANLVQDREVLIHARQVATELYTADPGLARPEH